MLQSIGGIHYSDDQGDTWDKLFDMEKIEGSAILSFDVEDDIVAIGTFGNGFWLSKNGGKDFSLDLSHLMSGTYVITTEFDSNEKISEKIIITK